MKFFHRTTCQNAEQILREGFRDGRGTYLTDREWEGIWLWDRPDAAPGADGALLQVTLPSPIDMDQFEWVGESGLAEYREWLVPAALLNTGAHIAPMRALRMIVTKAKAIQKCCR
jgi:hypothetical protein